MFVDMLIKICCHSGMIIQKAFKFRLRPNGRTQNLCAQFAGACRWVYNRGLARRKELWEEEGKSLTLFDQNKEVTQLKRREETEWLQTIHSQALQQALGDLDQVYQNFFARVKRGEKPGYPHFRSKGSRDSFRYPQGVKIKDDWVFLPKIGWVRFRKSREIEGTLKQTTVILDGGKWYVSFVCELERPSCPEIQPKTVLGIDLGLEHFAVMADERGITEIANPRFLRNELSHLRYLSPQPRRHHPHQLLERLKR